MTIRQYILPVAAQLYFKEASSIQWQEKHDWFTLSQGDFHINPNDEYWHCLKQSDSGGAFTAVLSTSPRVMPTIDRLRQVNLVAGTPPPLLQ